MNLFLLAFNVNTPAVKYAILALSAPLWLPFVRALWREFNDILVEEGGLLGRVPEEDELRQIRRAKQDREATLVRELRDAHAFAPSTRPDLGRKAGFLSPGQRAGGTSPAPRRRGFGPPR